MASLVKSRYQNTGHRIIVYPDASGNSRTSNNANEGDLAILRSAGFTVSIHATLPSKSGAVSQRNDAKGQCVQIPGTSAALVESLDEQAYDKHGEPDKASGLDHVVDAVGYFFPCRYPIQKRIIGRVGIAGV